MKLMTVELRRKMPALYAQMDKGEEAIAYVKFFTPDAQWTWYGTELNEDDGDEMYGLVIGEESELGYFCLSELEQVRGPLGLKVERDLYFTPQTLSKLREEAGA